MRAEHARKNERHRRSPVRAAGRATLRLAACAASQGPRAFAVLTTGSQRASAPASGVLVVSSARFAPDAVARVAAVYRAQPRSRRADDETTR